MKVGVPQFTFLCDLLRKRTGVDSHYSTEERESECESETEREGEEQVI